MKTVSKKRNIKITLLALIAIFILPIVLARLAFHYPTLFKEETINHGELFTSHITLKDLNIYYQTGQPIKFTENKSLHRKWLLLLFIPKTCKQSCQRRLFFMRQIQLATGKYRNRIKRGILTDLSISHDQFVQLRYDYPQTQVFYTQTNTFQKIMHKFLKKQTLATGSLFIIDPLGNFVLFYPPASKPIAIYKDLKRLLNTSQIG